MVSAGTAAGSAAVARRAAQFPHKYVRVRIMGFTDFGRVCGFSAQHHTAFFEPVSHSRMDRCAKDATCEGPEQIDLAALAGDLLQNCSRHFQVMHCPSELTRAVLWFPGLRLPGIRCHLANSAQIGTVWSTVHWRKVGDAANPQSLNCLNALKSLALPREVREANNSNWLQNGLGKKGVIEFQDISEGPPKPSLAAMRAANPALIPRNHLVEEAISAAVNDGYFQPFESLLTVLSMPYEDQPAFGHYVDPPRPDQVVHNTFCGT